MSPHEKLSQGEFIALMAMVMATVAFSIDAMLPALPEIAVALSPDNLNRAQLIITSFVLGMGIGTMFTGPLSDAFGRKPVMIVGAVVYIAAALAAWATTSLEWMLAARLIQGLGAAGPRVVAMAMVRDLYNGRDMARILSFIMVIFTLVPALAPSLGALIIATVGWRAIFLAFVVFALITVAWLGLRQPETMAPANRRPVSFGALRLAVIEVFRHPTTRLSIFVQTLTFGMLFSVLSSTQLVFDQTFDQGGNFHLWFGGIAVVAASASVINARLVGRLGMRALVRAMFIVQIVMTSLMIAITLTNPRLDVALAVYVVWTTSVFFQAGMTIGNLNALAMEPMGHIAGVAASVISAFATIGAVIIAVPIGLSFNGTPLPIALGLLPLAVLALWLTSKIKRPGEV